MDKFDTNIVKGNYKKISCPYCGNNDYCCETLGDFLKSDNNFKINYCINCKNKCIVLNKK